MLNLQPGELNSPELGRAGQSPPPGSVINITNQLLRRDTVTHRRMRPTDAATCSGIVAYPADMMVLS
eukprot:401689-Prorocentrum_minimum.AAC.1